METPTLDNFVCYEKTGEPDEYGCCRIYQMWGVRNNANSIYLWRNYNIFDTEPTIIPDGFVLEHNGYSDCDECNALACCCQNHIEGRTAHLQEYRFGTKVFVEDYTPVTVKVPVEAEIVLIHDNGGRPFKVYVDHERKEVHIFSLNRNLIFSSKADRKDYTRSNCVKFVDVVQVQLAMNPAETKDDEVSNSPTRAETETSSETEDEDVQEVQEQKMFYDQHIGTYAYEKIWIPDGLYLTRNDDGNVVQDKSSHYYGNSVLCHLGQNRYLSIGESVQEFTTNNNDTIQRYYSVVGNSDVPYPVAVGNKYVYFMLDIVAEPIKKYANLTEEQLSDAYSYYFGHLCFMCSRSECDCVKPAYDREGLSSKTICKRDF